MVKSVNKRDLDNTYTIDYSRDFFMAVKDIYQEMFLVVPDQDWVYVWQSKSKNGYTGNVYQYTQFLSKYAADMVSFLDKESFLCELSCEKVCEFLKNNGKEHKFFVRFLMLCGERKWHEVLMLKLTEDKVAVFIRENHVYYQKYIEQLVNEKEHELIVGIQVKTGYFNIYCGEEYVPEFSQTISSSDYETMIYAGLYSKLPSEETENVLQKLSLENIIKQLDEKEVFNTYVMINLDGELKYRKYHYIYMNEKKSVILWSVLDVTKDMKKEREKSLALQGALIREATANKYKNEFFSRISHDIRTPLAAIQGLSILIGRHAEDPGYVLKRIADINKSSDFLLTLLDGLVEMSNIVGNNVKLDDVPFSLHEMLEEQFTVIRSQMDEYEHNFTVDISGIVHDYVCGDRKRLSLIFMNLVTNAMKYTPNGGEISFCMKEIIGPDISSNNHANSGLSEDTTQPERYHYQISVKDNGIGIGEDFLERIFEPFERETDTRINHISGTGLGLSIAKDYVERMDGEIRIITEVDVGSEFIVDLKLKPAGKQEQQKRRSFSIETFH